MRILPAGLMLLGFAISPTVAALELELHWDPDLAFEADRENYEKLLRSRVGAAVRDVAGTLEITLLRPLVIRLLTPAGFARQFGEDTAAAYGARYRQGAIFVNGGNRLDDRFEALLGHELVHAFLDRDGRSGCLPTWLNEGLAERLRWHRLGIDALVTNQIAELQRAQEASLLTPLPTRGPLTPFGYLQSFAVTLFLEKAHGPGAPRQLAKAILDCCDTERGLASLRTDLRDLEKRFAAWVRKLS